MGAVIADPEAGVRANRSTCEFLKKYFAAGQKTTHDYEEQMKLSPPSPFSQFAFRHRGILGLVIPGIVVLSFWTPLAIEYNFFRLFPIHYDMFIVMIVGSFIGGATAEGSGAISFPVMTLILHTPSTVARDFSAMIQTVGMTSAALSVQIMGVLIERHTLIFATIGGMVGTVLSLEFLEPVLSGEVKKMVFVSVFFSFAMALYRLNREKKRITYDQIQNFDLTKSIVLLCTGFIGGIFAGIGGSGIDVFSFSVITLLYRVNEKVATPTTVSLAGINSAFMVFWGNYMLKNVDQQSWDIFAVCAPLACIMSPLGTFTSSYLHRQTLAFCVYILETAALVGAVVILQPGWKLLVFCVVLIFVCFAFYLTLEKVGKRMLTSGTALVTPKISTSEHSETFEATGKPQQDPEIIWIRPSSNQ